VTFIKSWKIIFAESERAGLVQKENSYVELKSVSKTEEECCYLKMDGQHLRQHRFHYGSTQLRVRKDISSFTDEPKYAEIKRVFEEQGATSKL